MPPRKPKVPLTAKRREWATTRAVAPVFKGQRLAVPAALQVHYSAELLDLVRELTKTTAREVRKLFEGDVGAAHFGEDASIASQSRILMNALGDKFNALFASNAKPLAESMVGRATKASGTALHASLQKLSGGMSLQSSVMDKALLQVAKASITENVSLIKSIASEYLQQVEGSVMRSITTGNGLQDLVPALSKYEGMTERRATNIALDQTRKVYNNVNKGRMQALGLSKFQWHHSGGGAHPREDHVKMDGQIYSFDDPPVIDERAGERGIPGQAPNCRCTMSPVFDFGDDS